MTAANKIVVNTSNFVRDVVQASHTTPVLVDFWAAWCGPCKQLMPVLDRLADEYAGRFILAKVNTDEEQALAQQVGIRSLPTVVLFKNGQVADHFVGAVPESNIRQLLDRHVPPAQQTPLQKARELKAAGDYDSAQLMLDQLLTQSADAIDLLCELGEVKALRGDLDGAKELLARVQAREPAAQSTKRLAAVIEFNDVVRAHPDPAALRQQLADDPAAVDARHALAVHRLLAGDYDAALQDWLELMRTHRTYKDDLARRSLLMAFELIGHSDPRVADARRAMARMLF